MPRQGRAPAAVPARLRSAPAAPLPRLCRPAGVTSVEPADPGHAHQGGRGLLFDWAAVADGSQWAEGPAEWGARPPPPSPRREGGARFPAAPTGGRGRTD